MLYKKLQVTKIKKERIYKRFKRLTLSFIVVTSLSYFIHHGISDITETFFSGVSADQYDLPEHQARLLQLQQDDAELTLLGGQLTGKQPKIVLKACTGSKDKLDDEGNKINKCFNGTYYSNYVKTKNVNGFIEEYYSGEYCSNFLIVPGTSLMSKATQGIAYFIFLIYLFLGISINADIFMESIEVITSSTMDVVAKDKNGNLVTYQVPKWNPTIANLTLMALGSSAPEILLSVIESLKDLGEPAGVLGPASIVGSGAFNLLVISGISILSVDAPKKIYDLRVYSVTATFSLFSYAWMYICLEVTSPEIVTITEAWLTLFFFFLLVGTAFIADKITQRAEDKKKKDKESKEEVIKEELNIKKSQLRSFAKNYGEQTVISIARGNGESQVMTQTEQDTIIDTYKQILETNDLSQVTAAEMREILQPDSLLEKFKAKKANKMSRNQEFIQIRGTKGQLEEQKSTQASKNLNDQIGFKCLHYSVLESSGEVELTITKKVKEHEVKFGVRTISTTAIPSSDYTEIDSQHTMSSGEEHLSIKVPILDDREWQPDLEFQVEIYDPETSKRLIGDDTVARVTILDEDFPGTLGFEVTMLTVSRDQEYINILIKREKGSDGKISCNIKTEPLDMDPDADQNAKENIDYSPLDTYVEFKNGEMVKTQTVQLMNPLNNYNSRDLGGDQEKDSEVENPEKMFKVVLSEPKPDNLQISKKNVCIITILQNSEGDKELMREKALLEYFFEQQEPTWKQQFKNAVMLGPSLDEDDMVINQPSLSDALFHFSLITWKLVFAFIPPVKSFGGWPAFFIALAMVGGITFIVGDVAEILGCSLAIPSAVSAITLVAIGTSLPDTFASVTAAQGSEYADSAIGNVTGSNSVNIFLGLGLPWVICTMYGNSINAPYVVPAGELSFTVLVFLVCSVLVFGLLTARRMIVGGELGGPMVSKVITAGICFFLWVVYITLSILQQYGLIAS